ncbi:YheC/YheD family protein [Thalassobacillus pellis]|uniref:YheC/YheD family protein n=1 Tax=Thalassobacillus pellis TaxID=748008 RepID=UPI00196142E1|nr:YheC/YheD family protein [Thalassobacillus pellis]MBM7552580.1 glutathione synthase/RimK-type ligase-like ATP-grasp enzyme [Thalassobacillus pellis]
MKDKVGILVSEVLYSRIKRKAFTHENIAFYEQAGDQYGVSLCYLRLADLIPGHKFVKALVPTEKDNYIQIKIEKPRVIHNRMLGTTGMDKRKFTLLKKEGVSFFNEITRYSKLDIYNKLISDAKLAKHQPDTMPVTKENLQVMMKKHKQLIIKPDLGTLGSGVSKLTRESERTWTLDDGRSRQAFSIKAVWPKKLEDLCTVGGYIVQEKIPLAAFYGSAFDIRAAVQKDINGEWQVTGLVGKAAGKGKFVTNVARGGRCYSLEMILEDCDLDKEKVKLSLEELALHVAHVLDHHIPSLADIGLDIGLTSEGFPMFIECNGRDQRYSFKEAGLLEVWKMTYFHPIGYARWLLNQSE